MKNTDFKFNLPLHLCFLAFCLVFVNFASAQYTYLKISPETHESTSFPPGSKFEIKNVNNKVILSSNDEAQKIEIKDKSTLTIKTFYKKEPDVLRLYSGYAEIIKSDYTFHNNTSKYNYSYMSNGLSLESTVSNSLIDPKLKNIKLVFSNGVVFTYEDGVTKAIQNGLDLEITGKYLVQTDGGLIKISFNPKNAEMWWVYELK